MLYKFIVANVRILLKLCRVQPFNISQNIFLNNKNLIIIHRYCHQQKSQSHKLRCKTKFDMTSIRKYFNVCCSIDSRSGGNVGGSVNYDDGRFSAGASVDHNIKTQHTDYHLSGTGMYLTGWIQFKLLTILPMTVSSFPLEFKGF